MRPGIVILFLLLLTSCGKPDHASDEKAILEFLKREQQAHLEKNVDLLFANGLSGITVVSQGTVSNPTDEETRKRFNSYFESVNFIKWEDTADPIIRFSDDASLAYSIIQNVVLYI